MILVFNWIPLIRWYHFGGYISLARLLIKSAILMPGAKEGEVTVVQIESEGYNKQKVRDEMLDYFLVRSCKLFFQSPSDLPEFPRLHHHVGHDSPPPGGGADRGHEGRHGLPDLRGSPRARTGQDIAAPGLEAA